MIMRTIKQLEALLADGRISGTDIIDYVIYNYGNENENFDNFPVIEEYCEVESSGKNQCAVFGTWSSSGQIIDWEWERRHFSDGCEKQPDGHIYKKIFFDTVYQIINGKITIVRLYDVLEGTYDVVFDDDENSNCKGFSDSLDFCKKYISSKNNGSNESYFEDYKGGFVSILCHETGETVYQEAIL